jgi:DNA-binding MarR family transcriptional regulator
VVDPLRCVVSADAPGSERTAATAGGTDWLDPRQDEVWRLLVSVHGRLLARLDREMRRCHGCSQADYEVLLALSEHDGALRMSDLAERVMLSPSGLTRRVDRLVRRGLVSRRACPSDGRGSLAGLTEAGWEDLRQAAPTHVSGVRRYLLGPVSPEGIEQLASGLRSVRQALDGAAGADPPADSGRQPQGSGPLPGHGPQPGSDPPPDHGPQPGSDPATTG